MLVVLEALAAGVRRGQAGEALSEPRHAVPSRFLQVPWVLCDLVPQVNGVTRHGSDGASPYLAPADKLLSIRYPDVLDLNSVPEIFPTLGLMIVEPVALFAVIDPGRLKIPGRFSF
jgi:hypothetical protein